MKFIIIFLQLLLLIFLASCQRETFSQRRLRLIQERKRLVSSTTESPSRIKSTPTILPVENSSNQQRHDKVKSHELDRNDELLEIVVNTRFQRNVDESLPLIPPTLGIVATLLMAAGQTNDFRLNDTLPVDGFQYMKYPDSFRRSLLQISQESYDAFLMAHINMDNIRLSTLTVPDYMEEAVRILATGDWDLIRREFHLTLKVIKMSMRDNVEWSMQMAKRFEMLSNLINEVHMASTMTHSTKENERSQLVKSQSISQRSLQSVEKLRDTMKKNLENEFDRFDRTADELVEAYKSIPTSTESFLMDLTQSVTEIVGFVPNLFRKQKITTSNIKSSSSKEIESASESYQHTQIDECIYSLRFAIFNISGMSAELLESYETLESIDSKNGTYNCTEDMNIYTNYKNETKSCSPVSFVIDLGIETVQAIHNLAHAKEIAGRSKKGQKKVNQQQTFDSWRKEEFLRVRSLAKEFYGNVTALATIAMSEPEMKIDLSNVSDPNENPSRWKSKQAKANAMYKISLQKETMRVLRDSVDKKLKALNQMTEKSIELLNKINSWKLKQVTTERAIAMLKEGITLINDLKKNWSQLVGFFSFMSNIVETYGGEKVQDFATQLENVANSTSYRNTNQLKTFVIGSIKKKLVRANQVTTVIHEMASTYCQISTDYLMPRVLTLDSMMKFNRSADISVERDALIQSCSNDESKIHQLNKSYLLVIKKKIEERGKQVQAEFDIITKGKVND